MARLIMWNVISIDGRFEGPSQWDLAFHRTILDDEFERFAIDQLRSAEGLLFGRVTFEGMAAHWPTATGEVADLMNAVPKLVFTSAAEVPAWKHTTVVRGDAADAVRTLKRERSGNWFVFGSANLSAALIEHDLFDEYRLLVAPVILGAGTLLFGPGVGTHAMRLTGSTPLASGGVILRYEPARGRPAS
jgi:dihydrofolate reductase